MALKESLPLIGLGIIVLGIFLIIISSFLKPEKAGDGTGKAETDAKVAVGGFIGPIPFGFAKDKAMLWVVIALSVVALLFFIIANTVMNK